VITRKRQDAAAHPPPVITGGPSWPKDLPEYLAAQARTRPPAHAAAGRVADRMVTAIAEGSEPPSLADLSGEDLATLEDVLAELLNHAREYAPATALVIQALHDYHRRVEIVPQRGSGRPAARLKPGPRADRFNLEPSTLTLPAEDVAARLRRMADAGAAAAGFLRSLAAGVAAGSGEADTRALDAAGRAAVASLLRAGGQARQDPDGDATAVPQCLAAWEAWQRETAQC
jgi:hypothetical protein